MAAVEGAGAPPDAPNVAGESAAPDPANVAGAGAAPDPPNLAPASAPPDPPNPGGSAEDEQSPEEEWFDEPIQPPLKRGRRPRKSSPAWPYFQVLGKVNKERAEFVRCKLPGCKTKIRRGILSKGGRALTTSGMLQHLYRHHWREVDSGFRAQTRSQKHHLCGIDPNSSEEETEAASADEADDEGSHPAGSAASATNPTPPGPPSAPLPGYIMLPSSHWDTVFINCATCGQCLTSREPDGIACHIAMRQHVCPTRR